MTQPAVHEPVKMPVHAAPRDAERGLMMLQVRQLVQRIARAQATLDREEESS